MWKLSPRILFLFLTCAMLSGCLSGAKLKCTFYLYAIGYLTNSYYCQVVDNAIYDGSRVTIDEVEGMHSGGKSNDNVDSIYFYQISSLTYFPRNIDNVFKNLIGIYVENSNLQEITQVDLRPFSKLKEFYLYSTKVSSIEKDLFKFNPDLQFIRLSRNQISHIDANVFDHLNNLERLELSGNKCKSQFSNVGTRSEVLSYIQRIKNGDCESPEILQKKKETEDQVIKNITTLQAANEECSTKFDEMKTNLESTINEKSTLTKDLNEFRIKFEDQSKKFSELQTKYENVQESLQDAKKIIEELNKKNQALMENSNQLKDKLLMSNEANSNLKDEILNLVKNKLTQSEKLIDRLIEKKTIANDDSEKKDGNSDCLTLYFGPQQRPIILTN